jgi:hypothetical protein
MNTAPRTLPLAQPDTSDLLTDAQLENLGRIKIRTQKIRDAIARTNQLAVDTGLPLRLVPDFPLGQLLNDISVLVFAHERAENWIRAAAFAAVEKAGVQ